MAARVIRAIGEPERRFEEDHLRLLRAVRFAARLGFGVESRTAAAVRLHAPQLKRISPERIADELRVIVRERPAEPPVAVFSQYLLAMDAGRQWLVPARGVGEPFPVPSLLRFSRLAQSGARRNEVPLIQGVRGSAIPRAE